MPCDPFRIFPAGIVCSAILEGTAVEMDGDDVHLI
jgi:hypothetical protein